MKVLFGKKAKEAFEEGLSYAGRAGYKFNYDFYKDFGYNHKNAYLYEIEEAFKKIVAEIGLCVEYGAGSAVANIILNADYGFFDSEEDYKEFLEQNRLDDFLSVTEVFWIKTL